MTLAHTMPPHFALPDPLTAGSALFRRTCIPLVLAIGLSAGTPGAWAEPAEVTTVAAEPGTSDLDAALFYQLLLGELQVRNSEPGAAYSLVLDAAKRTSRPELFRRAVDIALQGRAGNAALSATREWILRHPASSEAYRYEVQILISLNRPAEFVRPLRELVRLAPGEQKTHVISAIPQAVARLPDGVAALRSVRTALKDALADPGTAAIAWTTIGRLQTQQNALDDALASARHAFAADADTPLAAVLALELLERGIEPAETLVLRYLHATGSHPSDTRDRLALAYARLLGENGRTRDALVQADAILNRQPDHAEAWLTRGLLLANSRQRDEAGQAELALLRYLELSHQQPAESQRERQTQAYLQLAQLAEQRGEYTVATQWLDRIENAEAMLAAQLRRATVLVRQNRLQDALQLIRELPERDESDLRRKLSAEAQVLRQAGEWQQSYAAYTQASERFPNDADLAYERAMAAEKAGRHTEMTQQLRAIIDRWPDYYHAHNALGYAMADRGENLEEARTLIKQALRAAPRDAYILDSLGWVEFRLGNTETALRLLRDAFQRRPDPEIAAHLGEVLWITGMRDGALAVWREGLLLDPDNATLLKTLKRLQVQP